MYHIFSWSLNNEAKKKNPQFYKFQATPRHQFPPRTLSGSSNMLLESGAVVVSLAGGVFFDLSGAFGTGFAVLVVKMSSLKSREI